MGDLNILFFIILGLLVIIGLIALSIWLERRKREAFRIIAAQLGLSYDHSRNRDLARNYEFLNQLNSGSNRYASHVLSGNLDGLPVMAFDFHYETQSTDSKGNTQTEHHHYSVFLTTLPRAFPELTIRPEGIFSKVAQAFGYDDIDFESAEFSRRFCVRSRDRKFAYAVCHPAAMEFLLNLDKIDLEIEGHTLASIKLNSLRPDAVERELRCLLAFRNLLPEYLLKDEA